MRIVIIDYQMGNLRSVQKALEKVGAAAEVTSDPAVVESADKVVLPGVGAFGDAMRELKTRHLVDPIRRVIEQGRPFLGICLGLQLLFERGFEGGEHEGLAVLKGDVRRFELPHEYKIPHMGWNELLLNQPQCPLYAGLPATRQVYFVHSFFVEPQEASVVATTTDYGGPFCSSIARGNLVATQFHPEKSQEVGLQMLANFVNMYQ